MEICAALKGILRRRISSNGSSGKTKVPMSRYDHGKYIQYEEYESNLKIIKDR